MLALGALANSQVFRSLIEFQLAAAEPSGRGGVARSYEVGVIQKTPLANLSTSDVATFARLARRAWSLRRMLDTVNETSHAFILPSGLNEKVAGLNPDAIVRELETLQREIDQAGFSLYGIRPEDPASLVSTGDAPAEREESSPDEDNDDGDDLGDDDVSGVSSGAGVETLGSWLVGAAFARFDPRLATGERPVPLEPEPFQALPLRSPGMYPEGEEPAERPDILVDDQGHAADLAARTRAVAERVRVEAPENLRGWLAREFFPLHIRMYSKSRRKAPIYWQLATPSASYSVWLYIHAFSKDTLFRVQNDYAAPKLAHEERRLESLMSELRDGATAAQRKVLAAQETFVDELRAFLDEVKRVAPLWKPTLDDGVIINFAPLWRLVPQNKPWQKALKSTWNALCEGKYDWAHLAMHLWPERVVPRCASDRSLAIAHGLEDVFWAEDSNGKWTARKTPMRSINELVRERSSPGVKAALASILQTEVGRLAKKAGSRRRPLDAEA
ncbi:MAG: type II restriction endonuclease subunit M [Deltaproteobacteria bacterium]|nr:type II restriction endonuclease subunit M [Deltaproteobacteria bacterium]